MTKHIQPVTNCPQWDAIDQNPIESDGKGFLIICSRGPMRLFIYNDDHEFEIIDKKVLQILNAAGVISDYRISETRRGIRMVNIFTEIRVDKKLHAHGRQMKVFEFLRQNTEKNLDLLLATAIEETKEGSIEGIYIPEKHVSAIDLINELL